jgi:multisubunit Na+/H+ antiporter MnhB subunit
MGAVGAALVVGAIAAVAMLTTLFLIRPGGRSIAELPESKRRAILVTQVAMLVTTMVVVWSFAAGHAVVGIAVLVAVVVLPQLVLTPLRIRRSRAAAARRRFGDR